jgi:APA family basic amino acid/polyamine antiporter
MSGHSLNRVLGKGVSIASCVGVVIGLGIMRTPGEIATTVSAPVPYMALWIGGGLFVLLSILVVAELIAMTPRSGGIYALVKHAYGPYPGFLIGWTDWAANCASAALKSVVLLEYISMFAPSISDYQTVGAIFITSCFAMLQLGGSRLGAGIMQTASATIAFTMLVVACALFYGFFVNGAPVAPAANYGTDLVGVAGYGLVVAAVVYTYDGWYAASYFGGEVKGGGRAVAIGSVQGTLIVIAVYLLLNLALVLSVPLGELQGHDLALAGAIDYVFGAGTGMLIVFVAVFVLLAHQNLQYMMASRILYSLSVDGLGSRRATAVSDLGTPSIAVILSWLTIVALILVGQFEFLLNLTAILFVVMYVSLIIGVFRLRKQEPATERTFRAWGFPISGIICAVGWVAVALYVAVTSPESTAYGLLLILISAPIYLFLKRRRHLGEDDGATTIP